MLKTLIVDDVEMNRETLKLLIGKYLPQLIIVGTAGSADEGLELIRLTKPDLVFLDVEMPGGSGFDLLEKASGFELSVIFVTAFDRYAVRAFKVSAIDYLLKPINIDELIQAVDKVQSLDKKSFAQQLSILQESINQQDNKFAHRMAITTPGGLRFIDVDDLIRLEADGKYTRCHVQGEQVFLSSKNLGEFEKILNPDWFFRVHYSHLISLKCISTYSKENQEVVMENGDLVSVSQRRRVEFLKRFQMV